LDAKGYDGFVGAFERAGERLAQSIQRCIADGLSWDDAWNLTPRQLDAWIRLSERNRKINLAHDFANLCSAQGDGKHVQQHMTKLLEGIE
jgi:hypothetical protein